MESYLKIKAFAELTGLSVRTLQYYDEIDLLKPAHTNEHGHRLYDASSFSQVYVIQSLKRMGMRLSDIHQYIHDEKWDLQVFVEDQMHRVETEITNLQLQLIRLSRLSDQIRQNQDITPAILPLFAQIAHDNRVPQEQIDRWMNKGAEQPDFNLKDWQDFIESLNDCFKGQLTVSDPQALACVHYWKKNILEAHQVQDEMVSFAEDFYQHTSDPAYGMTADTYKYLTTLIRAYDSEQ